MTPRLLAIALLLVGSVGAQAQATQAACAEEASTPRINACLQRVLEARDKVLAAEVQRARAVWRERDALAAREGTVFRVGPALEKSQQAWEAYREQECSARALTYGYGTGAAAESLRCMIELTEQRTDAIARHWR